MSEQLEEIEHLSKELTKLTRTVKYYHQLFKKDGKISPQENDKINSINLMIGKIDRLIVDKKQLFESADKQATTATNTESTSIPSNIKQSVGKNGVNETADVRCIQQLLNKHGAQLEIDGACGPNTIQAIFDFQTKIGGFKPDGFITPGKSTWVALNQSPTNSSADTAPVPIADSGNSSDNQTITASVGKGGKNNKEDVLLVQRLLNKKNAGLTVDGACGNNTIKAIYNFQLSIGFQNPDSRIDPNGTSWKALAGNASTVVVDQNIDSGTVNAQLTKPSWIQIAEAEIGTKENTSKTEHDPRVMEYHATTGITNNDETPWCSSFVNWVMRKAGKGGTNNAMAISWKKYGKKVDKPAYGAIAVIDWDGPGPGWKGHVGFVVGKQGSKLLILGGNQSNAVNVKSFGTSKIVAYVFPSDYQIPESAYSFGEVSGDFGGMDLNSTR